MHKVKNPAGQLLPPTIKTQCLGGELQKGAEKEQAKWRIWTKGAGREATQGGEPGRAERGAQSCASALLPRAPRSGPGGH